MYRFYRCQPHKKCPDLFGWYLELRPNDFATFTHLHLGIARFYLLKYGLNSHKFDMPTPAYLVNLWVTQIRKLLSAGTTLLINSAGGLVPKADITIVAEHLSDRMIWPDIYDDEIITLSKWPDRKHWYLCSNKNRIIVPDKYSTYEAAYEAALTFVPKGRITSR